MLRNVIAIEHDGFKERVLSILFDVPNEEFDLISAAKAAAAEYCKTEEGLKTYFYNGESFDWADFVMSVPNEICERHGFKKVDSNLSDIVVDWDEQLVTRAEMPESDDEQKINVCIYDIQWDVDDGDDSDLPKEVTHVFYGYDSVDDSDLLDEIADWLTDEYEFCHFGFRVKLADSEE